MCLFQKLLPPYVNNSINDTSNSQSVRKIYKKNGIFSISALDLKKMVRDDLIKRNYEFFYTYNKNLVGVEKRSEKND